MAAFVYWNMPYQDAFLSEEQALDVTAFVLQQPRPHFIKEEITSNLSKPRENPQ